MWQKNQKAVQTECDNIFKMTPQQSCDDSSIIFQVY